MRFKPRGLLYALDDAFNEYKYFLKVHFHENGPLGNDLDPEIEILAKKVKEEVIKFYEDSKKLEKMARGFKRQEEEMKEKEKKEETKWQN